MPPSRSRDRPPLGALIEARKDAARRDERPLTYRDIEDASGVRAGVIHQWVNGTSEEPALFALLRVARFLEISADELVAAALAQEPWATAEREARAAQRLVQAKARAEALARRAQRPSDPGGTG